MAISSTIHKVALSSDMDRHYYQNHDLTVAQHPSENDFRLMIRLVAFILNADEQLSFTKGMNSDDEPELWQKSLTNDIDVWIDFGQLDEKRIRKACGRAKQVIIYTYHEGKATAWWQQIQDKLKRFNNLTVFHINADNVDAMISRSMQLQCTIQDGELYLSGDDSNITVTLDKLRA